MNGESVFLIDDHLQAAEEERSDSRKTLDEANNVRLEGIVKNLEVFDLCLYLHTKHTVSCMTIRGTMVTGTKRGIPRSNGSVRTNRNALEWGCRPIEISGRPIETSWLCTLY